MIGRVAGHGSCAKSGGEVVGSVLAEHLADAPLYERDVVRPSYLDEVQKLDVADIPEPGITTRCCDARAPELCSRRSIFER